MNTLVNRQRTVAAHGGSKAYLTRGNHLERNRIAITFYLILGFIVEGTL